MKRFALAAFIACLPSLVIAADLPIYKAPPPSAGYDWTGFYVGGNVGYSIGRTRTTSSIARANDPDRNFLLGIFTLSPAGAAAGFQVGYNRQIGAWVIGVEADWQWSGQKDSACHVLCVTSPGNPFSLTLEQRMKWFGTARGRIGYAWDRALWYVTAGGAWARIDDDFTLFQAAPQMTEIASASHTKAGWVIGGGVETGLAAGWSAKLEYLFMNFGNVTNDFSTPELAAAGGTSFPTSSDIRNHAVRFGLNYRFGQASPVAAKY
jgi:outer membrane immunogenic protein